MADDKKYTEPVDSLKKQNNQTEHKITPDNVEDYQEKMQELEIHLEYYKKNAECLQKNRDKLIKEIEAQENHLEDVKNKLERIANTKPYRMAYMLRRFTLEFRHGNLQDKKNFIKWIYLKILRRDNELKFKYNPLFELIQEEETKQTDKLEETNQETELEETNVTDKNQDA